MTYCETLQYSRNILLIYFHVVNEEGIEIFTSFNTDSSSQVGPFEPGRYVSTAWIPGNFLGEGILFISPTIRTCYPGTPHIREKDVVAFQVVASLDSDSLTAEFLPTRGGVVWPLLKWETQFRPNGNYVAVETMFGEENNQIDSFG